MGVVIPFPSQRTGGALLTKRRLAAYLGCSARTVERWMKQGLPFERDTRGRARFRLDSVVAWLDERKKAS